MTKEILNYALLSGVIAAVITGIINIIISLKTNKTQKFISHNTLKLSLLTEKKNKLINLHGELKNKANVLSIPFIYKSIANQVTSDDEKNEFLDSIPKYYGLIVTFKDKCKENLLDNFDNASVVSG